MRSCWLKVVGTAEKRIEDDWKTHRKLLDRHVMFPVQPRRIKTGDAIILYAAGWRVIFAVGEAITMPYPAPQVDPKYPWLVDVVWDESSSLPYVRYGLPLTTIGVDGKSVRQQSHIELSEEQHRAAVRTLRRVKAVLDERRSEPMSFEQRDRQRIEAIEKALRSEVAAVERISEEGGRSAEYDAAAAFRLENKALPPVYFTEDFVATTSLDEIPRLVHQIVAEARKTDRYTAIIVHAGGKFAHRPMR